MRIEKTANLATYVTFPVLRERLSDSGLIEANSTAILTGKYPHPASLDGVGVKGHDIKMLRYWEAPPFIYLR